MTPLPAVLGALEYAIDPTCIKNRMLRRSYGINLWMPTEWIPESKGLIHRHKKHVRYIPYARNKKKPERKPCLYVFVPYASMGDEVLIGEDIERKDGNGKVAPETATSAHVTVYVASCMKEVREITPWCTIPDELRGDEVDYSLPANGQATVMEVVLNFGPMDITVKLKTKTEKSIEEYSVTGGT